jgi:hypothetical protein
VNVFHREIQMVSNWIGIAVLAGIFILYLGIVYWKNNISVVVASEKEGFIVQTPAPAALPRRVRFQPEDNETTPSGPNAPNQAANPDEVVYYQPEEPLDPQYNDQESSEMPERLRYPERSFRPAPSNTDTDLAMMAGISGSPDPSQLQQVRMFNSEMGITGGEVMPGIFANDTSMATNFSGI